MSDQPCILVNYLYRRVPMPRSIRWHINAYRLSETPIVRVRGFVDEEGSADQLSIVLAVPAAPDGEIDTQTQREYEDLADEQFRRMRPDQQLA